MKPGTLGHRNAAFSGRQLSKLFIGVISLLMEYLQCFFGSSVVGDEAAPLSLVPNHSCVFLSQCLPQELGIQLPRTYSSLCASMGTEMGSGHSLPEGREQKGVQEKDSRGE